MGSVNFDRAADFYDDTRGFPDGVAEQVGQFIADTASLSHDDILLEIGIGTGRVALPLARYVKLIAGVDISHSMMSVLLQKRVSEPVFPVLADGHDLPYASNSFYAVTIVHVLHLVPDPVRILGDVGRVLKSGGRLLHCFGARKMGEETNPVVIAWQKNNPPRRTGYDWKQTAHALDTSGWRLQDEVTLPYSYTETPQQIYDKVKNRVWSSLWNTSDADIAPALDAITQAVNEHYSGNFQVEMIRHSGFTMQIFEPPV